MFTEKEREKFRDHLFDTLREGLLVLGNDLRVKKANSSFYDLFKIESGETKGKGLFELVDNQWDFPELRELLEKFLPEDKIIKDYLIEHTFEKIGHRVMLLNARQIDHAQLILLAFEDVTDRIQAMRELKITKENLEDRVEERTEQVRRLASQLTEIEQKERNRIADILHDDLQQYLFLIQMNLGSIRKRIDSGERDGKLEEEISETEKLSDQAMKKTRQLSSDLNPSVLKSAELTNMVEWLVKRFDERHNLKTDLQAEVNVMIHDEEVRVVLLKIIRELLFNIVKHSGTDRAFFKIVESAGEQITIHVIDDGSGFDMNQVDQKDHFGLFSVRERLNLIGGSLEVDSAPGEGTHITVKMPIGDDIRID